MMRYVSKAAVKSSKIKTVIQPELADTKRSFLILFAVLYQSCVFKCKATTFSTKRKGD